MARKRFQRGSIRKRGKRNPIWELLYWEDFIRTDGTIGRRQTTGILGYAREMTLKEAKKAAEEFLRPLNQGKLAPQSKLTFREFVEQFFVPNVFPTLKPSTRDRYGRTLQKHLVPAFGDQRLCDIGTLDIQRFVLKKMENGLGWQCADHFRNLLSKIFTMAKRWGYWSSDNPASGVELPEQRPVREKHALSPQQYAALTRTLEEPVRTMVELGVATGMRVGEILGLRWVDVDFEKAQLRIEQACYRGHIGSPKTKGSRRTVPAPRPLLQALTRLRAADPDQGKGLVFHTRNRTAYGDTNLLHRFLKPAGKQIGAPWLSWHALRRTHATLLQLAGGSLKDAQSQLGHSKLSTTLELYTVPIPEHQRKVVEDLSQLLTNVDELDGNKTDLPLATTQIQ